MKKAFAFLLLMANTSKFADCQDTKYTCGQPGICEEEGYFQIQLPNIEDCVNACLVDQKCAR